MLSNWILENIFILWNSFWNGSVCVVYTCIFRISISVALYCLIENMYNYTMYQLDILYWQVPVNKTSSNRTQKQKQYFVDFVVQYWSSLCSVSMCLTCYWAQRSLSFPDIWTHGMLRHGVISKEDIILKRYNNW